MYRCRVTALPGFSNSYKSSSTNGLTFAAMNPKMGGNKMYDLIYEPLDSNGAIVNKSAAATVDW